jgi:opacity protein-like surface antigen
MTFKNIIKPAALSCIVPLILTAQLANAENNSLYSNFVTIKAGFAQASGLGGNLQKDSVDPASVGGLEVGRAFTDMFAVSLEYSRRGKSEASKYIDQDTMHAWSVKSETFMVNLSANLMNDSKIMPYVKLGIGASKNKAGNYLESEYQGSSLSEQMSYPGKTKTKFAYQVGAGLSIPTNDRFDAQIEYMFVDRGRVKTEAGYYMMGEPSLVPDSAKTAKLRDHVITLGIKIKF